MPRQGSFKILRIAGIDVFLHWSWFFVAVFEINARSGRYSSIAWNVLEYLALFLIVTAHEFGHALACRQVGGKADRIVLWPLGGVAYVAPPPRPGATLWSLAAGPLVNVALLPVFFMLWRTARLSGWALSSPDVYHFVRALLVIDLSLLIFNMLPIYPLDGGQILRSLLWFVIGRARSLTVTTILGFMGIAGFMALAVWIHSTWIAVVSVFMLMNCWGGLKHARALSRIAKLPRRDGFSCPACGDKPPLGALWKCTQCGQAFDTFQSGAACPSCATRFPATQCFNCGSMRPISDWAMAAVTPAGL
jgi:Zn-dependent protease